MRTPSRMSLRSFAVAGLAGLLLLAACGDDDDDTGSASGAETTETEAPSATEPAASDTTVAGAEGSEAADEEAGATRTVEGAYGPIEIPTDPQRIFGDLMTVDYLTALGYDTDRIVGVFDAGWFGSIPDHYLADFFASHDLVDPGFQAAANLEQIAAAEPDLIVLPFDQIDGAETFEEMQQIAPLLVVPTSDTRDPEVRYGGTASFQDWRTTLRSYGELFDLSDEAEAYIAETEVQLEELRTEHGELIASITATEAKSTPDSMAINVLSTALDSGVLGTILMSELGFQAPPQQAEVLADEYGTVELSGENIDLLDGDLLFLEVREGSTFHEESPLWPTLQVVQSDGVVVVGNHWEYGGATAARVVIDDIATALAAFAARQG